MGSFDNVAAHIAGLDLNREKWRPEPRSERFSTVQWTRSTSQPVPAALPGRRSWARSTSRADPVDRSGPERLR